MRLTKTLGLAGALILSAVLGGTLIGSTFATDTTESPSGGSDAAGAAGRYCDVFLDELAAELGTTRDGLTAAGRAAATAALDAALAAGDISEERADALRERIEAYDGDACAWSGAGFVRGFHIGVERGIERGIARGFLGADVFEAAAAALGIDSADLVSQVRDAGSLEALASELGVSYDEVTSAVLAAVQADLDSAVAEGLSQEQADAVIDRLTTWLDEGGEIGPWRAGRGGFGPGHLHGPWSESRDKTETESDAPDA